MREIRKQIHWEKVKNYKAKQRRFDKQIIKETMPVIECCTGCEHE